MVGYAVCCHLLLLSYVWVLIDNKVWVRIEEVKAEADEMIEKLHDNIHFTTPDGKVPPRPSEKKTA